MTVIGQSYCSLLVGCQAEWAMWLKSLCCNAGFELFCRARLQAGTVDSSTCSPKGERYRGPARSCHTDSLAPDEVWDFFRKLAGRRTRGPHAHELENSTPTVRRLVRPDHGRSRPARRHGAVHRN